MKLINKYYSGGYTPRFNNEGKPILNPSNSKDVRWLHEQQANRGKQYYKQGMKEAEPIAKGMALLTAAPAITGAGISSFIEPLDVASVALNPTDWVNWLPFGIHGGSKLISKTIKPKVPNRIAGFSNDVSSIQMPNENTSPEVLTNGSDALDLHLQRLDLNRSALQNIMRSPKEFADANYAKWVKQLKDIDEPIMSKEEYIKKLKLIYDENGIADYDNNTITTLKGDKNLSVKDNVRDWIISHELDHIYRNMKDKVGNMIPSNFGFDFDFLNEGNWEKKYYLIGNSLDELKARGSQIKDYFKVGGKRGTKEGSITADLLKYASQNYTKDTGINNNMTEFFLGIKDWDKVADFISKYSTAIVPPALGIGYLMIRNETNK